MRISTHYCFLRVGVWLTMCALAVTMCDDANAGATFRVLATLPAIYQQPYGITESAPGLLYFVGSGNTVVSITTKGALTPITTFQDPPYVNESGPLSAANFRLYSSVASGSTGYVFSVDSKPGNKTYAVQAYVPTFTQSLPDGTLLSLAYQYSDASYTIAKTTLNGSVMTPIYSLPNSEYADFDLIYATDGNYYGSSTTAQKDSSYVYRITPSGSLTKIFTFPVAEQAYILQAGDGNLYGVAGSVSGLVSATIFKLSLSGQYTLLHTFAPGTANNVTQIIEASDGKIYGVTNSDNGGSGSRIFSITTSGEFKIVYNMTANDGQCSCTLVQGSDGVIYGAASGYGYTGAGTIFALDLGLPKPAPRERRFNPASGAVGTKVLIWGSNLFSASVEFNGLAAAEVYNSGPNYIWATVPAGATTGPITITTPGGTMTTAESFTVD